MNNRREVVAQVRRVLPILILSLCLFIALRHQSTSAQSLDPSQYPVLVRLHPQENIVGATNGVVFATYTLEFEFIDQITLLENPRLWPSFADVVWSPDGNRFGVILAGIEHPESNVILQMWDANTQEKLYEVPDVNLPAGIAWSPDSKRFAVRVHPFPSAKLIHILDADTGQTLLEIETPVPISQLAWSSDGTQLVFDAFDTIQVRDPNNGQLLRTLNVRLGSDTDFAFSPTENLLAFDNANTKASDVEIWNTDTGEWVQQLQGHTASLRSITWNVGGLVTTAFDDTVRIWDVSTGEATVFQVGLYPTADISADGTVLLIADRDTGIHTRDVVTGQIIAIFGD